MIVLFKVNKSTLTLGNPPALIRRMHTRVRSSADLTLLVGIQEVEIQAEGNKQKSILWQLKNKNTCMY